MVRNIDFPFNGYFNEKNENHRKAKTANKIA